MQVKRIWEIPSIHLESPSSRNMQVVFAPQRDPGIAGISLMVVTLYPHDGTTGLHVHEDSDEIIFVTSGRGEGVEGDATFEVTPDTAIYARKGIPHCVSNTSDETMRLICCFAPSMSEDRVRALTEGATVKVRKI